MGRSIEPMLSRKSSIAEAERAEEAEEAVEAAAPVPSAVVPITLHWIELQGLAPVPIDPLPSTVTLPHEAKSEGALSTTRGETGSAAVTTVICVCVCV
jgi:hypothetical protein